jgi:hypothetical protein
LFFCQAQTSWYLKENVFSELQILSPFFSPQTFREQHFD